ncbi:hydroxyethylthiazole kinase [Gracilibacillus boraciitolerans JCM 21714]|uniref:hydroxyethylthiazole kinase n=1 Tax=Gracilibacillus boraciitolerans JCM 21714 TaxID=1298598 RepID=W4VKZ1_9BACI|nr:hydroxyethylthiazole kinase [Gracilibacillus boraciitolerans JCM 21714]
MHALAEVAYSKLHIPLAITGAQDFIKDKDHLFIISNGHPILTKVTGAGCLLSSVCAAFLAISDDVALALTDAISYYGVAAEVAASKQQHPGSFQMAFLDQLYAIDGSVVQAKQRIIRS